MISDKGFVNIQAWMVTDLKLKGNDLIVYAIIFGLSQDGESKFYGSLQYLADWCGATKQGIQKNLKNLIEKNLIKKEETFNNGIKYCKYSCIPYNKVAYPIQQSCIPMQQSCTNNINNNKSENKVLSKDNTTPGFEFGKPKKQTLSLYDNCKSLIIAYTDDLKLQDALFRYLNLILEKYRNENKSLYVNQFKGMLNKLQSLDTRNKIKIEIVEQSISKGYVGFYPVNTGYSKPSFDNTAGIVIPKRACEMTEEELYSQLAKDEQGNLKNF